MQATVEGVPNLLMASLHRLIEGVSAAVHGITQLFDGGDNVGLVVVSVPITPCGGSIRGCLFGGGTHIAAWDDDTR